MLKCRHYDISNYVDKDTKEIINIKEYKNNNDSVLLGPIILEYLLKRRNTIYNDSDIVVLFYDSKIGIDIIKKVIKYMEIKKLNNIILIVKNKLTSFANKELKKYSNINLRLRI